MFFRKMDSEYGPQILLYLPGKIYALICPDKLKKFRDNAMFDHVIEPTRELLYEGFDLKGKWASKFFQNNKPIILELGCGKGDYTVGLARMFPEKNFIGIDIKGARIWAGANQAKEEGLKNVAFVRTQIELIDLCFGENEISEIWITFPDPQIKYNRAKHRLTHPSFLDKYKYILEKGGQIHLKCDSEFLHGYTHGIIQLLGCSVHESYHDIHKQLQDINHVLFSIKTYYENMWLEQGKAITYIRFSPDHA